MGYLYKKATYNLIPEKLIKELEEEERKKREEKAREVLGLPAPHTALLGSGLGVAGAALAKKLSNNYAQTLVDQELNQKFNLKNADAVEALLSKDNVKFLDSLALVPGAINSEHPIMLNAFKLLPKAEQKDILLRGGFLSPFAIPKEDTIWRGASDKVSAGVLAHEYGHILNQRDRKNTLFEHVSPALYGAGSVAPYAIASALGAAGLFGASDKTLLYGGLLGTATGLPRLIEEIKASYKGNQFLKEKGISADENLTPWSGLPTYLAPTLLPLLPFLARKAAKKLTKKDKPKKKDK